MDTLRMMIARLKDKFFIKVPTFSYSPAPCPSCGYVIEVPLTRTPQPITCIHCESDMFVMAVGIVDPDRDRLKHIYSDVINKILESGMTHNVTIN